jgi:site-specific recombinase XerD
MIALESQDQGTITLAQQDYLAITIESFDIDRRAQNVSPETVDFYRKKLKYFVDFCDAQAVTQVAQITPDLIRRYILRLSETHNQGGEHACFRPTRTLFLWADSEEIMPPDFSDQRVRAIH